MKRIQNDFFDKQLVELSRSSGWLSDRPIGPSGRLVQSIDQECNVDRLGLERYVFHFYEPVEQMIDRLVKRSTDWSSSRSIGQEIE